MLLNICTHDLNPWPGGRRTNDEITSSSVRFIASRDVVIRAEFNDSTEER